MDNKMTHRNPYRVMLDIRSDMDRLIEQAFSSPRLGFMSETSLDMDVSEDENQYIVKASIPGLDPKDMDITYTNKVLTIKGEVKGDEDKDNKRYHLRERWYGSFSRSISLPANVNADQIEASYDKGVLTLQLPKTEEEKPRKITVTTGDQKMLEGHFNNGKKSK
jgi:HSP20 family protein